MTTAAWLAGLVVVALIFAIYAARRWGQAKAEKDYFEESHDKSVEARKIDDKIARLSDADLDERLRGK